LAKHKSGERHEKAALVIGLLGRIVAGRRHRAKLFRPSDQDDRADLGRLDHRRRGAL